MVVRENGFDDVMLCKGETDILKVIKELKKIGFNGYLCPEHLPKVSFEPYEELANSWSIGYLSGILEVLD